MLLWIGRKRGTLQYPHMDDTITPSAIAANVKRTQEYFRNRDAYGALYDQYEAKYWWCVLVDALRRRPAHCAQLTAPRSAYSRAPAARSPRSHSTSARPRFEFGCTMRKMILTGALVLFGAGTTPQVVTALAVCIMWFALVANTKPFGEDVDDRLSQIESLQVLFTLLIGLVLQLEATKADGSSSMDDTNLGLVLIALNCVVVGLALVQQPIVLIVAARVVRIPQRIAEMRRAKRDWEKAWVVAPSDEDYRTCMRLEGRGGALALDVWCDVASNPPRTLRSAPLALVVERAADEADAKRWYFDGEGSVLKNPIQMKGVADGVTRWNDLDTMRVLKAPPIELFETTRFGSAVQWLDAETGTLLRAPPGWLVFEEPNPPDDAARVVWRHRTDGTLTSVNPGAPEKTSDEPHAIDPNGDEWRGFTTANAAREKTACGASIEMTALITNPLGPKRTVADALRPASSTGEIGASVLGALAEDGAAAGGTAPPKRDGTATQLVATPKPALAPEPDAPPTLPDGWEALTHEGNTYFVNVATGETQWEHPAEARRPSDGNTYTQKQQAMRSTRSIRMAKRGGAAPL